MPTILQQVQKIIADGCHFVPAEVITPEKKLREDLGLDSLDEVELVMAFEDEFDMDISDEDAEKLRTVGDYVTYLEQRAPRAA